MSRRRACEATGFACVARVNGSVQFIFTVFGILGLYEMYVDVGITRDDGVDWCYGPKWRGRGSACAQLGALAGRAVGSRGGSERWENGGTSDIHSGRLERRGQDEELNWGVYGRCWHAFLGVIGSLAGSGVVNDGSRGQDELSVSSQQQQQSRRRAAVCSRP